MRRLLPVSSPHGECPANLPFHVPAVTSLSLTPSTSCLASECLCSILCPRCSSHRPRLEVLNVSQNRVQCVTGLHLLPSLVVLNLGKCLCLHELVGGPGASVMRSPQRRPFATAPQRCPSYGRLCYYSFRAMQFSHAPSCANLSAAFANFQCCLIQTTTPLMSPNFTASCLDCAYCVSAPTA